LVDRRTQQWYDYGASSVVDQVDYTHDYAGNRLTRDIPSSLYGTDDKDHAYSYDDLHRLKTYDKGTLSGSSISGTPVNEEDWTLDALGNWTDFLQKASGTTTLNQDRTHNDVNEISTITATTGTNWADPVHDAAGNMTQIPKPSDLANSYDLTYDAWNRLVNVTDGASTVAEFEYDGLNRRIIKDDQTTVFHYYYNESWQCVEVREDTDTDPSKQYYWHNYYIDALALRYHDATGDGDFQDTDEIQYGSHDANFNVTALYESDGDVRERYEYTPYGEATVIDADFSSDADGVSDVDNAYLFTGRRLDEETGLYYFRNRYFGAQIGRFVNRDPILYDGNQMSLYEFVGSKPTVSLDPTGTVVVVRCKCACTELVGLSTFRTKEYVNQVVTPSETAAKVCKNACDNRTRVWKTKCGVKRGIVCSLESWRKRGAKPDNISDFWDLYRGCKRSVCVAGCITTGGFIARQCAKIPNPVAKADCLLGASAFSAACIASCSRCELP